MVAVIEDHLGGSTASLDLLNVGGSSGITDDVLAQHFRSVLSVDIDEAAVAYAQSTFHRPNLRFELGDALNLRYESGSFDVVICAHIYEHVADPRLMLGEISRVLKPGGICYFAADNRLLWNEPHYRLPLLSVLPRRLADAYLRLAGRGDHYYERLLTYWTLRSLVKGFALHDYTLRIVHDPAKYGADYMIRPGSAKAALAGSLMRIAYWLSPGYIWLLQKP